MIFESHSLQEMFTLLDEAFYKKRNQLNLASPKHYYILTPHTRETVTNRTPPPYPQLKICF